MAHSGFHARIAATGIYLPKEIIDNQAIVERIQSLKEGMDHLDPDWITERVGIETRRRCSPEEDMVTTSSDALRSALDNAGWDADELDFIILASISTWLDPKGSAIPSMASRVQETVGAYNSFAYDMLAACSGFVFALSQAAAFIESGLGSKGAVICSENHDKGLDFTDSKSSILIGDVSTATLLERSEQPQIHDFILQGNRKGVSSGIITLPFGGYFGLDGRPVFKEGVRTMRYLAREILERNQLGIADADWFIFHQANMVMLESVARSLEIPEGRNLCNIRELGNTTAGTIPSVLAMNVQNGTIKRGDKIVFTAFGGGITSGASLVTF